MKLFNSKEKKVYYISIIIIIILFFSCNENLTEYKEKPCPPSNIVPHPPYNSPIWHPNGEIIGFNYTPLDSIIYPNGKNCVGIQYFNYDSAGFWLIDTDGDKLSRALPFQLQTPCWSPDGQWIAFVLSDQIYKMRFDGSNFDTTSIQQLTFKGRNYFPDWSPDGNWIAFDSNNESINGGYRIWRMDSNGNNKYLVVNGRMPAWSDDLNNFLFIGLYGEVYKFNFKNNDTTRITYINKKNIYAFYNQYPKYIQNNSHIVFLSQPADALPNIYIMENNGFNLKQLTEEGIYGDSGTPFSISPDGKYIAYTKYNWDDWSYANGTLWILDIISGNKTQLTFNKQSNK